MEGIIYIAGALAFGVGYALLKPTVDGPWLIAIAVVYFGLLRLVGNYVAKRKLRIAIARVGDKHK